MVWDGVIWYAMVWYGMVWYGMYVCIYVCRQARSKITNMKNQIKEEVKADWEKINK